MASDDRLGAQPHVDPEASLERAHVETRGLGDLLDAHDRPIASDALDEIANARQLRADPCKKRSEKRLCQRDLLVDVGRFEDALRYDDSPEMRDAVSETES